MSTICLVSFRVSVMFGISIWLAGIKVVEVFNCN